MRRAPHAPRLTITLCVISAALACSGGGDGGGSDLPPQGDPPPQGGTPPFIASFWPTAGAVGAEITLSGVFAETAQGNTVRFNGVAATVLSASGTSLVAVVPAGATTGRIQVTTAGGTATSGVDFTVLSGPGAAWTTRLAGPRGYGGGLAWTGARYAAATSAGLESSTDGAVWSVSSVASADDIAWDGSLLVAVGSRFSVSTSPDGLTWTSRSLPGLAGRVRAVARSPHAWVGVGDYGVIVSSADAVAWTARESNATSSLRGLTWTGSRFIAVGEDGLVVTSPDGAAWTVRAAPTTDSFTAIGSSPTLTVATTFPYSGSTSALLTTVDGVDWTTTQPAPIIFDDVIHAGGGFVGVGSYRAATSPDGVAWTTAEGVPGSPGAVVHDGARYVAAGSDRNGAGAAFTSDDGLTWRMTAAGHRLFAIARRPSDGLLVVVGSDMARTSTDAGASWALHTLTPVLSENYPFLDVVWSPSAGAFVATVQVAANQYAYRSADGRAWTEIAYVPCYGKLGVSPTGRLVVTGTSYSGACVATSDDDGVTWTQRTPPGGGRIDKAFWLGDQFVGVGATGAIATSPDGETWTARASGSTAYLRSAAASPSVLVVVGDGSAILTSSDGGVTWTARSGATSSLRGVTWTGSEFLAVGGIGKALRSSDGASWTDVPTPYGGYTNPNTHELHGAAWIPEAGGRLVLVGDHGLIATSP